MTGRHHRVIAWLALLSRCAPSWRRHEWLREWSAEVESASTLRVWGLTVGAAAHLVWIWRREWQLDSIGADVRYGLRGLIRRPAFALTAIGTLALGVGATTTLATVISGVLLKPLPFAEPDRLVRLSESRDGATARASSGLAHQTLDTWKTQSTTIAEFGAYDTSAATIRADDRRSDRVNILSMSPQLFDTLAVRPAMGGGPGPETKSTDHRAWLSDASWREYYNAAPDVLGKIVWIDGQAFTIAGVMDRTFVFPDQSPAVSILLDEQVRFIDAIARLRPGVTPEQAAAEGTARARSAPDLGAVGVAVFGSAGPARVSVTPLLPALTADARPALWLLLAAAALLLATGVANVAGLQLANAAGRRREFAIRSAIGAGTIRTVRQLVIEHAILGIAGAGAAVLLAYWWNRMLPAWLPAGFPRAANVTLDARALLMALALSLAASQTFGLLPLWFVRRVTLTDALAEDGGAPVGGGMRTRVARLRSAILVAQVAVAAVLLVGAALLGRSLYTLATIDRGYDPSHLLTAQLPMPEHDFTRLQRVAALDGIIDRMRQIPGVTHAAASDIFPLVPLEFPRTIDLPPAGPGGASRRVKVASRTVSRDYFATIGMRVVEGRGFTGDDRLESPPSVVVNRAFVRANAEGRNIIGTSLPIKFAQSWNGATVVGVVDDVRQQAGAEPALPQLFACYCQIATGILGDVPALAIRTTLDPAALAPTLRAVVHDVAPLAGLTSVMTMEARLKERLAVPRLLAALVVALGAGALLIAVVGLVGALAHQVTLRAREIAIRAALGATPRDIAGGIARSAMLVTGIGTAAGLLAAFLLARWLDHVVTGVGVHDPLAFGLVPVVLILVALIAASAPARRASRVDPARVLKN